MKKIEPRAPNLRTPHQDPPLYLESNTSIDDTDDAALQGLTESNVVVIAGRFRRRPNHGLAAVQCI